MGGERGLGGAFGKHPVVAEGGVLGLTAERACAVVLVPVGDALVAEGVRTGEDRVGGEVEADGALLAVGEGLLDLVCDDQDAELVEELVELPKVEGGFPAGWRRDGCGRRCR